MDKKEEKPVFTLPKKKLLLFLNNLSKSQQLIAPVKEDLIQFKPIQDPSKIHLKHNTYFPLKEYFFKKKETLFQFNGKQFIQPKKKAQKRAFFGIRRCDLNAIKHQDLVFSQQVQDPYYLKEREQTTLMGYHCNTAPSPYCFCGSLKLEDFFDLMFYDKKTHFLVEVGSTKGKRLIQAHKQYFTPTTKKIAEKEKIIPGADRLRKKDIAKLYHHPDWKKGVDICLSCAACTTLCPTCYCFETNDEVSMKNPAQSQRTRQWSSCQLQSFSKVAGNHIFRKDREERFKHRIYHQLDYFKERYGVDLCVGCGRCIEGCPTRIDFVDIINKMK